MGGFDRRTGKRVFLLTASRQGRRNFLRLKHTTLALAFLALLMAGCAKEYTPLPLEDLRLQERAQTQSDKGVTVSAAILGAEESKHVFGVDLAKINVQPVWLEIRNERNTEQVFLPMSVDQDYFSPHEVFWKTRFQYDKEVNARMESLFLNLSIENVLPPNSTTSGFVLTPFHSGSVRIINVDILGPKDSTTFNFFLDIPGFLADHHLVKVDELYRKDQRFPCTTVAELRAELAKLPCCVTDKFEKEEGDPINIVIVTPKETIWHALVTRGWHETEPITGSSSMKTINAFMARKEYKTSPISALYVYGRGQDIAMQKARSTIHERNHLRLWLSPITLNGNEVWVGTISRDIGVKMTSKTWNLTTHEIDGNVDEARSYLIQDFAYSQSMEAFGYVKGVGATPMEAPRYNLTDSPWFSDGERVVIFLGEKHTPLEEITYHDWRE